MRVVRPHPEGATLTALVKPAAKKNAVQVDAVGRVKISVTAPPQDGRANEAIVALLHDWLGVRRSEIDLLTGQTRKEKVFLIRGVTAEDLTARLVERQQG